MEISCEKKECDGDCPPGIPITAKEVLSMGELIVYPTETLYGLGGDASDPDVIGRVKKVKNSPLDKKISVSYRSLDHASGYMDLPEEAWALGEEFLPGPLTLIVGNNDWTEGVRIPDHPVARTIIDEFGPITATSANIHDMKPPVEMETAKLQLGEENVGLFIDCGPCEYGQGSTVIRLGEEIKILREGVISAEEIGEILDL